MRCVVRVRSDKASSAMKGEAIVVHRDIWPKGETDFTGTVHANRFVRALSVSVCNVCGCIVCVQYIYIYILE